MLSFDPTTRNHWKKNNITDIVCSFIGGGCEGTTLLIEEGIQKGGIALGINDSSVLCHGEKHVLDAIDGGYITKTEGKWIVSSTKILTHCGCGKSFAVKTGNPLQDKIRLLRSKLEKHHHTHHEKIPQQ